MTGINDCFAVGDRLMSLEEAFALIAERIQPVTATETLPLRQCLGRVLAEPVRAPFNQPPFANAAMDGFAARFADLAAAGPTSLPIVGRIAAGHPAQAAFPAGGAVEIFTGAPMPAGFDTVAMVEDCHVDAGRVTLPAGLTARNFVHPVGEDFSTDDVLLQPGSRLRPQDLAMAATAGRPALAVREKLRVGVFSTGDEIIEPGLPLAAGQIYGGNRYGQMAVLEAWGFEVTDLGHIPDDARATREAFAEAAETLHAVVTSGGVSLGGEDHVRAAVEHLGRLHLWRLAVKPGKPVALGHIGNAAFVGLPGYPVSAIVTLLVAGRAVLHRLSGALAAPPLPPPLLLPAGFAFSKNHRRRQFLRGSIETVDRRQQVVAYRSQDSAVLSSLVRSGGLIDVGADAMTIAPGDLIPFLPYESLLQ